jgi:hypothetical protein
MRIAQISAVAAAVCLALAPAAAAGQKGKGGGAPKTTAHGPSTHAQAPQTQTTHGNPHTTTKTHGNPHTTTSTSGATTPVTTTPTTTTPTTTTSTTTPNAIAQKLEGKPLGSRIEKMIPANMTLDTASAGFKNQGQFIAALHVSQNLGISFANLKATMLGKPVAGSTLTLTPTSSPKSLGQAIQQLKPFANATTEASRAEAQTTSDLHTTSTTSSSITTTKAKKRGK